METKRWIFDAVQPTNHIALHAVQQYVPAEWRMHYALDIPAGWSIVRCAGDPPHFAASKLINHQVHHGIINGLMLLSKTLDLSNGDFSVYDFMCSKCPDTDTKMYAMVYDTLVAKHGSLDTIGLRHPNESFHDYGIGDEFIAPSKALRRVREHWFRACADSNTVFCMDIPADTKFDSETMKRFIAGNVKKEFHSLLYNAKLLRANKDNIVSMYMCLNLLLAMCTSLRNGESPLRGFDYKSMHDSERDYICRNASREKMEKYFGGYSGERFEWEVYCRLCLSVISPLAMDAWAALIVFSADTRQVIKRHAWSTVFHPEDYTGEHKDYWLEDCMISHHADLVVDYLISSKEVVAIGNAADLLPQVLTQTISGGMHKAPPDMLKSMALNYWDEVSTIPRMDSILREVMDSIAACIGTNLLTHVVSTNTHELAAQMIIDKLVNRITPDACAIAPQSVWAGKYSDEFAHSEYSLLKV